MVPKESQSDFGRYLQECRLASRLSLDEIAQQTKIIRSCLNQIENEELQNLPQAVFVKGFLRAYADAVGADAEEALRRYQNHCGIQQQIKRDEQASSLDKRLWFRFIFIVLLFAGAVGLTFYAVQLGRSDDVHQSQAETTEGDPQVKRRAPELSASSQTENDADSAAQTPTLHLGAKAVAYTRLKIIVDAGLPQEFELQPGAEIAVTAEKHMNLLIGNAGGIRLTLNDKPVTIPGKNGQMVTINLP